MGARRSWAMIMDLNPAEAWWVDTYSPPVTVHYGYDADGNLLFDDCWMYTWDAEDRLIRVQTRSSAFVAGALGRRIDFAYDYLGRRVSKPVYSGTPPDPSLVSLGEPLTRSQPAGNLGPVHVTRFVFNGWSLIAEFDDRRTPRGVTFGVWTLAAP